MTVPAEPMDRRLHAARPLTADVAPDAANRPEAQALLREISTQPLVESRRTGVSGRRIIRVGVVTGALAAAAVAIGVTGHQTSPQVAAANPVALALHWFAAPAGDLLHVRSVLTEAADPSSASVQETWQVVGDPSHWRIATVQNGVRAESGPEGVYDPTQNTIYLNVLSRARERAGVKLAIARKVRGMRSAGASPSEIRNVLGVERRILHGDSDKNRGVATEPPAGNESAGDPLVAQVRSVLENGGASTISREVHDGVEAYAIQLDPNTAKPPAEESSTVRWTLWLEQSDGRPLELRIDNGPATAAIETTTWTTYEIAKSADAGEVTLKGAHPDATVIRDPGALDEATTRLFPSG